MSETAYERTLRVRAAERRMFLRLYDEATKVAIPGTELAAAILELKNSADGARSTITWYEDVRDRRLAEEHEATTRAESARRYEGEEHQCEAEAVATGRMTVWYHCTNKGTWVVRLDDGTDLVVCGTHKLKWTRTPRRLTRYKPRDWRGVIIRETR
jgi:hypothetical protein